MSLWRDQDRTGVANRQIFSLEKNESQINIGISKNYPFIFLKHNTFLRHMMKELDRLFPVIGMIDYMIRSCDSTHGVIAKNLEAGPATMRSKYLKNCILNLGHSAKPSLHKRICYQK